MAGPQHILVVLLAFAALSIGSCGEGASTPIATTSSPHGVAVELERVEGSFEQPLYLASPPNDASRLFVVEKGGRVRIIADGILLDEPFLDLSDQVSTGSEQGLLSLAFDLDFAQTRRFYVNFTDANGATRVASFRAQRDDPNRVDDGSRAEVLTVTQPYANHNGGQLQFGPDGRLYIGTGDGGAAGDPQGHAQDAFSQLGKILRVALDGSTPSVETYALGLRNPWRFSFDRETGALWIADVGQGEREEVNYLPPLQPPGANFGWNAYEGSRVYDEAAAARLNADDLIWPVTEYDRSVGRSVTGGYVYRGNDVPALRGYYVFGDYASGRVWTLARPSATPVPLAGADGRVSSLASLGEDASGELYLVSLAGSVYKIVPAP